MSKWKRITKVIEDSRNRDKNSNLFKKKIVEEHIYHEKQGYFNEEVFPNVVSIELHKKKFHQAQREEKNGPFSLFHKPNYQDHGEFNISLEIQLPNLDQTLFFVNELESEIKCGTIKAQGNFCFTATTDLDTATHLLRTLNQMALFSREMKQDFLTWLFTDVNSEAARKFAINAFSDIALKKSPKM